MMTIKALDPGCPNCQKLEKLEIKSITELKVNAKVIKITEFKNISKHIMMTPGVVIDEKVKNSGKPLPRVKQIKAWIQEENKI